MKTRVGAVAVLAGLVAAGAFYATSARGHAQVSLCKRVRVSGGAFNSMTGGVALAGVQVRNIGTGDCTINARPWIRLGPTRYAVTIRDATSVSEGTLVLHAGQHAVAHVEVVPGSCDRGVGTTFGLAARVGWARRSVPVSGNGCKNGTAEILVGAFRR